MRLILSAFLVVTLNSVAQVFAGSGSDSGGGNSVQGMNIEVFEVREFPQKIQLAMNLLQTRASEVSDQQMLAFLEGMNTKRIFLIPFALDTSLERHNLINMNETEIMLSNIQLEQQNVHQIALEILRRGKGNLAQQEFFQAARVYFGK